jgi:predicted dehydrogenase
MFAEATQNQEELSVVGDRGKVEAMIPGNVVRRGRRGEHSIGHVETIDVTDDSIGYEGDHHGSSLIEHHRFIDAVRSGRDPEVTVHDGLLSVALGVAAQLSIADERPVHMSEVL